MLFDLASDVSEQRDLAEEHPEKLAELKQRYEAWSQEVDGDARGVAGYRPPDLQFRSATVDRWLGHQRHSFLFQGRKAWAVKPEQLRPGNPWSWVMMFPDAFAERCAAPQLLAAGFRHAYLDLGNTSGSPEAIA